MLGLLPVWIITLLRLVQTINLNSKDLRYLGIKLRREASNVLRGLNHQAKLFGAQPIVTRNGKQQSHGRRIRDPSSILYCPGGALAVLQQLPSVSTKDQGLLLHLTDAQNVLEGATSQYRPSSALLKSVFARGTHITTFSFGASKLMALTVAMGSLQPSLLTSPPCPHFETYLPIAQGGATTVDGQAVITTAKAQTAFSLIVL